MKTLIFSIIFLVPLMSIAQTSITDDYDTYAYYKEDASNKNDTYIWLYDGESFKMNFPKTATGLEALKDKVDFIVGLSDVSTPYANNSMVPAEYSNLKNTRQIHDLIMQDKMNLFLTYHIVTKRLELVATKDGYYFYVTNNY
ncbi:hypothetical protein [Chryseobacterium chendengshani]|uniref:hypothetical protein n=1 Tax=Chryseobacterium sp. LJ756 TaxID=2864113 RepID=UPI001C644697|nr:hypothetical protein [Chryseobacterium sp. LJ756]MBW7676146.1 hypothetical protein [Chryseobacterium sp. LJ756]